LVEEIGLEGTALDGSAVAERTTTNVEFVAEPLAMHAVVATDMGGMEAFLGFLGFEDNTLEMFVDDDGTYMGVFGSWMYTSAEAMGKGFEAGGWSFETSDTSMALPTVPQELPDAGYAATYHLTRWLRQADYLGQQTYNGLATKHYSLELESFDPELAPADMVIDRAEGELFLAEDGDYVVYMEVKLEGENLAAPAGGGEPRLLEGTLSYSSSLTAINEPLDIEVPDDVLEATKLPDDIPVPDNLHQILGGEFMGMSMYAFLADDPPANIVSLLTAAMPESGWVQGAVEETGDAYRFEYSQEKRSIVVDISVEPESGKTLVAITGGGPDGFLSIFQGQ
jgi:hypothetical protein